ncbi:MAG: CAP domain-containing protein [bacterium]|nr:CAP domain-containing protein [bacterium]
MRSPLYTILLGIALFAVPAYAQNDLRPQAILVGVIGAAKSSPAAVRTVNASFSTSSLGSANSVEARAFELMNAQRLANGLQSLQWDEQIIALARTHSQSMAEGKYFSHKDPSGGFVDSRASKLGIFNWMAIGENIAFMKGYDDPGSMAVEKWMQSTSHKKNILSGQWRDSAIGVAVADDGAIYFTQVFIAK